MLSRFSIYFEEVARQGSIRQASERLKIASSAVDRQILQMEERLGVKLFERTSQGLRLTSAGELMLKSVRRWRREMGILQTQIEDLRGLRRGEVSIAAVEGAVEFVSRALASFRRIYPGIVYEVRVAGAQAVTDAVLKGEVEIGLTVSPKEGFGLRVERTLLYQIGALVPPSHPLAQFKEASVLDCNDYQLVISDSSISLRDTVDELWKREAGVKPRIAAVADSIGAMKSLVKAGLGVGLMTQFDAMLEINAGLLVFVPLLGKKIPLSIFSIISATNRVPSTPAALLAQHLGGAMMAEENPSV